jgi:hypothetical protein
VVWERAQTIFILYLHIHAQRQVRSQNGPNEILDKGHAENAENARLSLTTMPTSVIPICASIICPYNCSAAGRDAKPLHIRTEGCLAAASSTCCNHDTFARGSSRTNSSAPPKSASPCLQVMRIPEQHQAGTYHSTGDLSDTLTTFLGIYTSAQLSTGLRYPTHPSSAQHVSFVGNPVSEAGSNA